jgi:SAM-dependent methyltransferase
LASGGDALEFAVGTGRIALPLWAAGVRVDGIELSQHMVDRMREKPGGDQVEVTMGDMSRVTTGRTYGLVYLVYNTIGNLLTQNDQVRCFENAARHLTDDGVFVLECRVPTAPARPGHQFIDVERLWSAPHVPSPLWSPKATMFSAGQMAAVTRDCHCVGVAYGSSEKSAGEGPWPQ